MKHGITSLIFSLEMSSQEIAMRMLSAESGVRLSKMQAGKMSDVDWRKVAETTSRMSEAPLFVDDSANITISEIRSKCRRLKQQENLGLVVIDYLQLMTSGRQVESRQQEVSAMSRNLKLLAKDLDIPVIAVSQLNRNSEGRTDRKPMMSDLRESGSLEQDADIIILLHRPDYYDKEDRPGEADIIVAKHRAARPRPSPPSSRATWRASSTTRDAQSPASAESKGRLARLLGRAVWCAPPVFRAPSGPAA